ncbi:unnamed protein product [Ectocarpus sp. 12 AP-2014]
MAFPAAFTTQLSARNADMCFFVKEDLRIMLRPSFVSVNSFQQTFAALYRTFIPCQHCQCEIWFPHDASLMNQTISARVSVSKAKRPAQDGGTCVTNEVSVWI